MNSDQDKGKEQKVLHIATRYYSGDRMVGRGHCVTAEGTRPRGGSFTKFDGRRAADMAAADNHEIQTRVFKLALTRRAPSFFDIEFLHVSTPSRRGHVCSTHPPTTVNHVGFMRRDLHYV